MNWDAKTTGLLWVNVDYVLRIIDHLYKQAIAHIEPEVSVIEAFILRALYERDGQRASDLARAVGRAPTAFTLILDRLQHQKLIERRPDRSDRRAINVYLTAQGKQIQKPLLRALTDLDTKLQTHIPAALQTPFEQTLLLLQSLKVPDE